MSYQINENKGDIIYEVVDRELVLKVNPALFEGLGGGSGGSECSIDIIKKYDLTVPTDQNVFSSLRTLAEIKSSLIEANGMFLRKDIDDVAHGVISHDKELKSTIYIDGWEGKGWEIKPTGHGEFDSLRVRSDIYAKGHIGSPTFASGFAGWGLDVDMTKASAEMDNLFIRKTFTVYELVYSQAYGLGGSVIISDLNKIASVTEMDDRYRCYMDSMDALMMMNLRKGDGIRIQRKTLEGGIKYIFSRCLGVTNEYFDMRKPIIAGSGVPEKGDFAFRWGNESDTDRQGLIYQTSSDSGAPFIDVYDGITGESTEGCLKVRLGKLTGIRTRKGDTLNGYGGYLNSIYIENSTYITDTGETVDQRFVAMNGKFESVIDGIRDDMSKESGNILKNPVFDQNTNYWDSTSTAHFISVNGLFLWQNDSFYIEKNSISDIVTDGSRKVLRIRSNSITQKNAVLDLSKVEFEVVDGANVAKVFSFSFKYRVRRSGTLTVGFDGSELYSSALLEESSEYKKFSMAGKWDGSGDFKISFTGEILIYGVALMDDALANVKIKLETGIEQTNEQIKLYAKKDYVDDVTGQIYLHYDTELKLTAEQISAQATRIDNINNTIATAGWLTTADGNKLWASQSGVNALGQRVTTAESSITQNANAITQKVSSTDFNGNTIVSLVNQTSTSYQIQAKNINLVGSVSFSSMDNSTSTTLHKYGTTADNALTAANNAQAGVNAIPDWSKQASITKALTDATIINGGYLKTTLIDVDNLYTKRLKVVKSDWGTTAAIYLGSVDSANVNTANARVTGFGVNVNMYISGSTSLTTDINNIIVDNLASSNKKTTLVVKCSGGAKNTAMAILGNVAITGDIANLGIPLYDTMPSSDIGFDHNTVIITSVSNVWLPRGIDLKNWFGENPNYAKQYGTSNAEDRDAQVYDLYIYNATWNPYDLTVNGSNADDDGTEISNTLVGKGVNTSGRGSIVIPKGQCCHFKKIRRQWVVVGI